MRALILLGVLGMAGCDLLATTCTLQACPQPFRVRFDKASAWPAGNYRIEVEADGVRGSCVAQLPLTSCQVATGCAGQVAWSMDLFGCALPGDSGRISGVSFRDQEPRTVKVSVFHDDRSIGTSSFTPSYAVNHPNGRDCAPECRTAPEASLALE
jgi:hypothetical protein